MINDSDIPILGQPKEEEIELPQPDDVVRKLGDSTIESLPIMDLISMGFSDTNRLEFYLGDQAGDYYVKLMPHHEFIDIGWKNQMKKWSKETKAAQEQKEEFESVGSTQVVAFPEPPPSPKNCTWTNAGMLYKITIWQDRQHDHIFDVLHSEVLSKIDIFAKSRKKREEDPWKCVK